MRVISAVEFLSPAEVAALAAKTGIGQSSTFAKRQTQLVGFTQALGSRIGFPQKTIATAQQLILRFYLFYNPSEFVPHEVALACTSMASKMSDTPKKPREIILSSWALRFPDMVRSVASVASSAKPASASGSSASHHQSLGSVSESDIDPAMLEKERKRVIAIESLILKSIAFSFNTSVNECFRLVIKICRYWEADKELGRLAWQVCADCHRTYSPLNYPASTIAVASIWTAALLLQLRDVDGKNRVRCSKIFERVYQIRALSSEFCTTVECVEEVVHSLLDTYISAASTLHANSASASATPISPATPASPAEPAPMDTSGEGRPMANSMNSIRKIAPHVYSPPPFGVLACVNDGEVATELPADLTQIKIALRNKEDERKASQYTHGHDVPSFDLATLAQTIRPFEIGGIRGDMRDGQQDSDALVTAWATRAEDKQFASLQRYLF
jgi:CTD kinase subunit beta